MIKHILWVGLGGGLGSIARYLCQRWIQVAYPQAFPLGTFIVNLSGCFLIGLFWGLAYRSFVTNENWKLFLMTGICGGYTTFSAFTLEGIALIRQQKPGLFLLYAGGSVAGGLAATYLGMKIFRS